MTLAESCLLIADCPHTTARDEGVGYPLVRTPNVGFGRLVYAGMHRVSEKVYNCRNKRAVPSPGDLIYAREAPAGNVAVIEPGEKVCLGQRTVLLRPNPRVVDSHYLAYYLLSPEHRNELVGQASGATVLHVNLSDIRSLKVSFPKIDVQRRIVAVVNDYYSAIDNARRQIALLEEAAMRLYREWFDGTGKGWKRTPVVLADVLERLGTGLNPRKNFTLGHGENFYVTIKNMANNRVYLDSKCDKVDDEAIRKINRRSDLRKGDVLFSGIGTIGRAYLIAEAPKNWNTSESVFNLRANSRITPEFLYMLMLSSKMQQYAMNNATGCAQKGIRAAALRAYQFDLAPLIEIEKFTAQVRPMLNAVNDLNKKIDSLTEARDRLLPKLMSGEIEV